MRSKLLTAVTAYSISTLKDFRFVSLSLTYTRKGSPSHSKKQLTVDADFLKRMVSRSKACQAMTRKSSTMKSKMYKEEVFMAKDKWKVIWLDEMGNEKSTYHETEEERNTQLQALADDGYSPVYREID